MVRFVPNGRTGAGFKGKEAGGAGGFGGLGVDDARKIRYAVFILALMFILFRGDTTISRVNVAGGRLQQGGFGGRRSEKRTAPPPAAVASTASVMVRHDDDDSDKNNENMTLPDLKGVLEESRRDNMTMIRFSNESWVAEWRADQAAKRDQKPVRNIDWSLVDCVDSTEEYHRCDLSDDRWGVPVILLSFGRSGSSITWETMGNLASARGQPAREDIGGSSSSATKELNSIKPEEHGKCWLERIMCRHQYNNRWAIQRGEGKAEIIGTKWKPFLKAFNHTKSREALEWLAGNPHIKVIFNERNFLDVTISRYKHLHTSAPAHCYGEQCIEYHKMQLANTSVPVRFIKDTLDLLERQADGIQTILEELKVPHLKVLYERLYYARRADQWMDIFRFVGVGPMMGLTMDLVRAHMTQFSTHADDRSEAVGNFGQIRKALRHTEYNKYLRPVVRKSKNEHDRGEVVLD